MAKKTELRTGLKNEPETLLKTPRPAFAPEIPAAEALQSPALLVSRLTHTATISYNGEAIQVPPRGRVKVANRNKVGALPRGITVVPL